MIIYLKATTSAYRVLSSRLHSRGPIRALEVMGETLTELDRPEEEVGGDIFDAVVLMIRSGAVQCSTANLDRSEITIRDDTMLMPRYLN